MRQSVEEHSRGIYPDGRAATWIDQTLREKPFMGLVLGIITGASLLACALVAVWMVGAIYYDVCGGAKLGRWVALAWAAGVIAMLVAWRPLWQPIVAVLGAESLFLVWWFRQKPSNDRDWDSSMTELPRAVIAGDVVTIENVRNLEYRSIVASAKHRLRRKMMRFRNWRILRYAPRHQIQICAL